MHVAVAEVAEGRDLQLMPHPDLLDEGDDLGETAARHGDILENGRRANPGEGGEGAAPRRGEPRRVGFVRRLLDGDGSALPRDLGHGGGFLLDHGGMPVGLHQDHGRGFGRQADLGVVLDASAGLAVEEFKGAGDDVALDDLRDAPRGGLHRVEGGEQGAPRLGTGHELQEHLGDDA